MLMALNVGAAPSSLTDAADVSGCGGVNCGASAGGSGWLGRCWIRALVLRRRRSLRK